jgi:hypothetical protein
MTSPLGRDVLGEECMQLGYFVSVRWILIKMACGSRAFRQLTYNKWGRWIPQTQTAPAAYSRQTHGGSLSVRARVSRIHRSNFSGHVT